MWAPWNNVEGGVFDKQNGSSPSPEVSVACLKVNAERLGTAVVTGDDGRFKFRLARGGLYFVAFRVNRSTQKAQITEHFLHSSKSRKDLRILFPAREIDVQILSSIPFEHNRSALLSDYGAFSMLKTTLKAMQENPSLNLVLGGHTSITGRRSHNMSLSIDRLKSVRSWLQSQGISDDRIICLSYGEDFPLDDTDVEDDGRSSAARVNRAVTQMLVPSSREYRRFLGARDSDVGSSLKTLEYPSSLTSLPPFCRSFFPLKD